MARAPEATLRVAGGFGDIDAGRWDQLANPDPATHDPFLSHGFFDALERSGSIGPDTGWLPRHLLLESGDGRLEAALPLYLKSHSFGEYVFDHGWAEAYQRHGLAYYPKLLSAVPVTPVPGRRLLVAPGTEAVARERLLAEAAIALAGRAGASSIHVTFLTEGEARRLAPLGFLTRTGQQYHFTNPGYRSFDDFLATLSSRKRKGLKRERRDALRNGLAIEWVEGRAITEAHWDSFFSFYTDTGNRKWGAPYLNRRFFSLVGERLGKRVLLILCRRDGKAIAGALNIVGGQALHGRYWGAIEHHPFLHFEVCYYQAIDYAIANGLARVEAGAGGEHKLVRGYLPVPTYSAHWIGDPRFRAAIADFVERERLAVERERAALAAFAPFKKEG